MEYPLSELLDRLSILTLHINWAEATPEIIQEETRFFNAAERYPNRPEKMWSWLGTLKELNGQIWDLESDIRRGKEGELGLEEVGRRALAIRDINKKRIALKNEINAATGAFIERKTDHASA